MSADTMLELAERAACSPFNRELDAEIHAKLFGTVDAAPVGITYRDAFDQLRGHPGPYHFTGHVEGAEMALPGPEWPEYQITRRYCTGYHASIGMGEDGAGCETAATALLSAALRARAAMEQSS
jgi:hypothetical protein